MFWDLSLQLSTRDSNYSSLILQDHDILIVDSRLERTPLTVYSKLNLSRHGLGCAAFSEERLLVFRGKEKIGVKTSYSIASQSFGSNGLALRF